MKKLFKNIICTLLSLALLLAMGAFSFAAQPEQDELPLPEKPQFTKQEQDFIANCKGITVAHIPESQPGAYLNEHGEYIGIVVDTMNLVSELCGIEFNNIFIPSDMAPLQFIKQNPDCIVSGVLANNTAFNSPDVLKTESFYHAYSAMAVLTERARAIDIDTGSYTIGTIASFQAMQLFIEQNYPNLSIVKYHTVKDGLTALANRDVDLFVYDLNNMILHLGNPRFGNISIFESHFMTSPLCTIAVSNDDNRILIGIINKCFQAIPEETIDIIEKDHLRKNVYRFNDEDILYRYRFTILIVVTVFAISVTLLLSLLMLRQRKYNKEITHQAQRDLMTDVYNRGTSRALIEQYLSTHPGNRCALLMVDLDNLKGINDLRGHSVGDEAIKGIANVLKSQFRETDIIGRIGGDEYIVFLDGISTKEIMTPILDRLFKALSATPIADGALYLQCSVGVTFAVAGEIDPEELYRQADEAMYRAKSAGKHRYAYYDEEPDTHGGTDAVKPAIADISTEPQQVNTAKSVDCPQAEQLTFTLEDGVAPTLRDLVLDSFVNLGVYVIEQDTHKLLYFNRRFNEICPDVRLGMNCRELMRGPCHNCPVDAMGENAIAHTIIYSDTISDTVEMTATKILWYNNTPAVVVSVWPRDISAISDSELYHTTGKDAADYLSGGLTRAGFIRSVDRMRNNGTELTQYAVLFINIKDFKAVNEMVGNIGGDNLLRTVYKRVEQSDFRPLIGSRKESDHFIFLVEKSRLELNRLPELLNFHWKYGETDLFVHCRCGVFNIDDASLEVYKMIDRAKLAKENIVDDYVQPYAVFNSSMLDDYAEKAKAFLFFDNAMKNREFVVYYQPIVDPKTEKVVSAEALVRHISADGTISSPGKFIPTLERTGYVSMLDRFVAEEVVAFQNRQRDKGQPFVPISFNLSQKDFYDSALMEHIATELENSSLPEGSIMLEITESAYTLNERKHGEYISRLRDSGAKIMLDDFGTGYSSFGMFENYNFDKVKLDMSFIRLLSCKENVKIVVDAIISMCHSLGVQVVAEGVETEQELNTLRSLNCDCIQGYYFAKPMDEKNYLEYLNEHI